VRRAAKAVEKAQAVLRQKIYAASLSGESYREIAPHAGMSHTQVADQVKKAAAERKE